MKIHQVITCTASQLRRTLAERFPHHACGSPLFAGKWNTIYAPDPLRAGSRIVVVTEWEEGQALDRQMISEIELESSAEASALHMVAVATKAIRNTLDRTDEQIPGLLGQAFEEMLNTAGKLGDIGQETCGFQTFTDWCVLRGITRTDVAIRIAASGKRECTSTTTGDAAATSVKAVMVKPSGITGIDNREAASIVAALRYWQAVAAPLPRSCGDLHSYFSGSSHSPLSSEEIDALCKRLSE